MFATVPLLLALFLGCSSSEPEVTEPAAQAERAAPAGAMGARAKGAKGAKGAKHAKGAKGASKQGKGGAHAKRGKPPAGKAAPAGRGGAPATAAKGAKSPRKGGAETPPEPIGVAGPITGTLALAKGGTDAEPLTTASLAFSWEGGSKDLPLGEVKGTCKDNVPEPITSDDAQVTPVWSVTCDTSGKYDARIAIVVDGTTVSVRRAKVEGDKVSPYRTLKRLKLVEGAELTRGG
ncbi:MAG: hypothetical protein ACI9K2_000595 [Myxococcota bacterium]|jgi:hypothetical protein